MQTKGFNTKHVPIDQQDRVCKKKKKNFYLAVAMRASANDPETSTVDTNSG